MDIREKKTKRSMYNAFLELRSKKQLEKITVKELSEAAEISKATFYLHYKDIYDLSEQLQSKVLQDIIDEIPNPDLFLNNPAEAHKMLQTAFLSNQTLISILFSGNQVSVLPTNIEIELKKSIFEAHPELKNDVRINTSLTFLIMGGFYAYINNSRYFPSGDVSVAMEEILSQYRKD